MRELIREGVIADGEVDERSIVDVQPDDLRGFAQCHFFAGIGGWAYALRLAGIGDDERVWTGSCPCQPFSAAGKGEGFDDSRHLWPTWFRLIRECRPAMVFGEQVASSDGLAWFDTVSTDLEEEGYSVGAADLCAAGAGAPHIRQRLYFAGMADGNSAGRGLERSGELRTIGNASRRDDADGRGADERMGDTSGEGLPQQRSKRRVSREEGIGGARKTSERAGSPVVSGMADANGWQSSNGDVQRSGEHGRIAQDSGAGFWSDVVWLPCTDGKLRPTKPGIFPLATGVSGRVGLLRGAGNSIVPQTAAAFIEAVKEAINEVTP